jgi:hypothetical protein
VVGAPAIGGWAVAGPAVAVTIVGVVSTGRVAPAGRWVPAAGRARSGGRGHECLHLLAVAEAAQVVAEGERARVAQLRVLREQLGDDRLERSRHALDDLVERGRLVVHLLVGDRDRVLAGERRLAGHHLVHHDPERVQVAARVGLGALGLFG